jgi:CRP-like cAMP-binding protein
VRKIDCDSCTTKDEGQFCDLPAETLIDLRSAGVATLYRPRQVLFGEGNPADGLYLVCQGRVKLYQSDRFGRERVLEIASEGSIVGELPVDDQQVLSASAEAIEDSQICFISHARLVPLLREHPDVAVRLVEALSRELSRARQKVRDLVFKDAAGRLATLVLDLAEEKGTYRGAAEVRFPYSRAELAQRIGVSTETAIRLLSKLSRRGVLSVDGRAVQIPDLERLTRVAKSDELEA